MLQGLSHWNFAQTQSNDGMVTFSYRCSNPIIQYRHHHHHHQSQRDKAPHSIRQACGYSLPYQSQFNKPLPSKHYRRRSRTSVESTNLTSSSPPIRGLQSVEVDLRSPPYVSTACCFDAKETLHSGFKITVVNITTYVLTFWHRSFTFNSNKSPT